MKLEELFSSDNKKGLYMSFHLLFKGCKVLHYCDFFVILHAHHAGHLRP